MFKSDNKHLVEFIEYHKLVGATHFYMLNNDDDTKESDAILNRYDGLVSNIHMPGFAMMVKGYNHVLSICQTKWLAFLDLDEFLFPVQHDTVNEVLEKYDKPDVGSIAASWYAFGSNHLVKNNKLQIDAFLRRAPAGHPETDFFKSVVKPKHVQWMNNPHSAFLKDGYNCVDELGNVVLDDARNAVCGDVIRINHYMVRSWEDFEAKMSRGGGDGCPKDYEYWKYYNINEVYDDAISKKFGSKLRGL